MDRSASPLEDLESDRKGRKEDNIVDKFSTFETSYDRYSKRLKIHIEGNTASEDDLLMNVSKMCRMFGKLEDQKIEINPISHKKELLVTYACTEESNHAKNSIQRGDIKDPGLQQYLATHRLSIHVSFIPVPADESRICLAFENVSNDAEIHNQLLLMVRHHAQPEGEWTYSQESEAVYVFFKNRMDASNVMSKMQGQALGGRELYVKSAIPRNDSFLQTRHLWIGNIDDKVIGEKLLNERFSPYGEIETIKIFKLKAHAFVDFFSVPSAANAKFFLDGAYFGNMKIIIRFGKQEFSRSLRVNLQQHVNTLTHDELSSLFGKYGIISNIDVIHTRPGDVAHALIDYVNEDDAKNALNDLQGAIIGGHGLSIDYNMRKRQRDNSFHQRDNNRDNRGKSDDKSNKKRKTDNVVEGTQSIPILPSSNNNRTPSSDPKDLNKSERVIPLQQNHGVALVTGATMATIEKPIVTLPYYHPSLSSSSSSSSDHRPLHGTIMKNERLDDMLSRAIKHEMIEDNDTPKITLSQFRDNVILKYQKCLLTECNVLEACEVCHVQPVVYNGNNDTSNGLLLRKDISSLVDIHLIRLKPIPNTNKVEVEVDSKLDRSEYEKLSGKMVTVDDNVTRELLSLKMRGPNIWFKIAHPK